MTIPGPNLRDDPLQRTTMAWARTGLVLIVLTLLVTRGVVILGGSTLIDVIFGAAVAGLGLTGVLLVWTRIRQLRGWNSHGEVHVPSPPRMSKRFQLSVLLVVFALGIAGGILAWIVLVR